MTIVNPEIYLAVMNCLTQIDAWNDIAVNNPIMDSKSRCICDKLDGFRAELSDEVVENLTRDIFDYVTASIDAGILYGIQVAASMNKIITNPNIYANYFMENIIKANE